LFEDSESHTISETAAADLRFKPHGRRDRSSECLRDEMKAGEMDWSLRTQHKCVGNFVCLEGICHLGELGSDRRVTSKGAIMK
jgi:hypothetical protein